MANLVQIELPNSREILAEVASSAEEQRIGMLKHDSIVGKPAMLFPYTNPTDVVFHTVGMRFPIDICFLEKADKRCAMMDLSLFSVEELQEALRAMEELGEDYNDDLTYREILDELHRRIETEM